MILIQRNLISNRNFYLEHAKSTGQFRLTLDSIAQSKLWSQQSSSPNGINDFSFWLIFGLSPNLGHTVNWSKRLSQQVKSPSVLYTLPDTYPQNGTRGQSNLTKSASRGANSPVRGHPRGSKVVPLNSWGRVSY